MFPDAVVGKLPLFLYERAITFDLPFINQVRRRTQELFPDFQARPLAVRKLSSPLNSRKKCNNLTFEKKEKDCCNGKVSTLEPKGKA
jgi:hypothetical protein